MIDAPVYVYVDYKNLSPIVSQSEYQKDLIASVLKKIEGQTKIILEYPGENSSSQKETNYKFWEAKCVICFNLDEKNEIVLNSVEKIYKNKSQNALISFDTKNLSGNISSWKIELTEIKPFLVRAGSDVKIHLISEDGLIMQSSGKSLKNGSYGDVVRVQIESWFHKSNSISNSTEVILAKVIAPNEVNYVGKQ